jgi:hypothetical protein
MTVSSFSNSVQERPISTAGEFNHDLGVKINEFDTVSMPLTLNNPELNIGFV